LIAPPAGVVKISEARVALPPSANHGRVTAAGEYAFNLHTCEARDGKEAEDASR